VVTPDGYLYSREAILENLLQQKKGIKRKLAEWEAAQKAEDDKVGAVPPGCYQLSARRARAHARAREGERGRERVGDYRDCVASLQLASSAGP
jgi:hypothetical protein